MAATETCIGFIFRGARGRRRTNSLGPSGRTSRTFSGATGGTIENIEARAQKVARFIGDVTDLARAQSP